MLVKNTYGLLAGVFLSAVSCSPETGRTQDASLFPDINPKNEIVYESEYFSSRSGDHNNQIIYNTVAQTVRSSGGHVIQSYEQCDSDSFRCIKETGTIEYSVPKCGAKLGIGKIWKIEGSSFEILTHGKYRFKDGFLPVWIIRKHTNKLEVFLLYNESIGLVAVQYPADKFGDQKYKLNSERGLFSCGQ